MFGALLLFEEEFIHVVAISFTALILTELTMVALTIRYRVSQSCGHFGTDPGPLIHASYPLLFSSLTFKTPKELI